MFSTIARLISAWISLESAASLFAFASTIVLFGYVFLRLWNDESLKWSKFTRFGVAILNGVIFIGIVGSFYFLLSNSYKAFYSSALTLSKGEGVTEKIKEIRRNWGSGIVQEDLDVTQTISHEEVIKIIQADGTDAYINRIVTEPVEQESIVGFNGNVILHLVDKKFNTYKVDALYEYEVVNPTDSITLAKFRFIIGKSRSYSKLLVFVDGEEVASAKTLNDGVVSWGLELLPGQNIVLQVAYTTQGMDAYSYQIPTRKPIRNFVLTILSDSRGLYSVTQPETTAIQLEKELTDSSYKFVWTIDNSILEPKLGVRFRSSISPDPNQKTMILLLKYMPRGMMLLTTMVLFTLIICGLNVNLWRFLLFTAIYSANFLLLMGLDLVKINNQLVLPIAGIFSLAVIYLIYQKLPILPSRLTIIVSILFLFLYPYAGLIEKSLQRNAFDSIVQAVVILYIFCLSLYTRIWSKNAQGARKNL